MLTAELLTAVRDYGAIAPNKDDASDAALLRMLNQEQSLYLSALLKKAHGKFFQARQSITLGTSLRFQIPRRALAAGVRRVEGVDSSGRTWMLYDFDDSKQARWWPRNGDFYIEGNEIVFFQQPPAGTLNVVYSRRLGTLVDALSCPAITNISGTTVTAGNLSPPAGFPGAVALDLVQKDPLFDVQMDFACSALASMTIIFSAALPTWLAVGDLVCLPGQTGVCQAPVELHPVLAQRVAFKWLEAKGDPRVATAHSSLEEMAAEAMDLIEPRIEETAPLANPYAPGWGGVRRMGR